MRGGLCGDQTTCVPTLASMGTRGFESWSIIWGKKNCIISPRGVGSVGCVFNRRQAPCTRLFLQASDLLGGDLAQPVQGGGLS